MKQATMLFKEGGDQVFVPGGKGFHTIIVDATEVEAKIAEGWKTTFFENPESEPEKAPESEPEKAPESEPEKAPESEPAAAPAPVSASRRAK